MNIVDSYRVWADLPRGPEADRRGRTIVQQIMAIRARPSQPLADLQACARVERAMARRLSEQMRFDRSDAVEVQMEAPSEVRAEQDVVLEDMSKSLARLGDVARGIDQSLTAGAVDIEEASREFDETQTRLDWANRRMEKLMSRRGWLGCIGVLLGVAFLLFFALVYS